MIYAFLVNRQNVKMLKHFCYFFIKIRLKDKFCITNGLIILPAPSVFVSSM